MASFNARAQVPNDINIDKNYISSTNLKTQTNINHISNWTEKQKMMLNIKKTNYMIFNFTNNHQFSTRFSINEEHIEEKQNVKLLGTIISNNLKWEENTKLLVKKANARMSLLRAVSRFSPPKSDLKLIYIQYIRSLLEQSCVLWHASLTLEDQDNIERVQKNALRIILKKSYTNYENALNMLNLETLKERRLELSLRFAKKCEKNPRFNDLFKEKIKSHEMELRKSDIIEINHCNTERYYNSAVPFMQRQLNQFYREKEDNSHTD